MSFKNSETALQMRGIPNMTTSIASDTPLLTVVTVTRNAKAILQRTIDSVNAQTVRGMIEYLVIDGDSDDGTVELIRSNDARIDRWISEKDKGIYDAMNKGIAMARGLWIHFLNAGDVFVDNGIVERVGLENRKADIVYGDNHRIYPDGFWVYDRAKPVDYLWKGMICSHQSLFAKRELLVTHPFQTKYSICADFQFLQWAYREGRVFERVDYAVSKVEIERYTWRQLREGLIQKWKASKETLPRRCTDCSFLKSLLLLGFKHAVKRIIPISKLKAAR